MSSRPGVRHELQLGAEDQEGHEAEPENRHGIADQAQKADHLVRPPALVHGRDHAHGPAEEHAEEGGDGGSSNVAGNTRVMSESTG